MPKSRQKISLPGAFWAQSSPNVLFFKHPCMSIVSCGMSKPRLTILYSCLFLYTVKLTLRYNSFMCKTSEEYLSQIHLCQAKARWFSSIYSELVPNTPQYLMEFRISVGIWDFWRIWRCVPNRHILSSIWISNINTNWEHLKLGGVYEYKWLVAYSWKAIWQINKGGYSLQIFKSTIYNLKKFNDFSF